MAAVPTEVWTAAGSAPLSKWDNATKLRRSFDADVRGYVVEFSSLAAGACRPSLNGARRHAPCDAAATLSVGHSD